MLIRNALISIENKIQGVDSRKVNFFVQKYAEAFLGTESRPDDYGGIDFFFDPIETFKIGTLDFIVEEIDDKIVISTSINKQNFEPHISMKKDSAHDIQMKAEAMSEAHCDFFRALHSHVYSLTGLQLFNEIQIKDKQ